MARSVISRPWRTLGALVALFAVLYGLVAAGAAWGGGQWTPKLALDLEGGTEFVLNAVPQAGQKGSVTQDTIDQAVVIIRQRVDGSGIAEAEVTTQGQNSIVVSLPGKNIDQATKDAIEKSAAMEFRPVLVAQAPTLPTPSVTGSVAPSASGSAAASATSTGAGTPSGTGAAISQATPKGTPTAGRTATPSTNGIPVRPELLAATPSPTGAASPTGATSPTGAANPTGAPASGAAAASGTASGAASPAASGSPSPAPKPTDASDLNWITAQIGSAYEALDCTSAAGQKQAQRQVNDETKPYVTCDQDGVKYILGPVEVHGRNITGATAGLQVNSQGQTSNTWEVDLTFDGTGADQFSAVTSRLVNLTSPRNQFAIVLDNLVISAPRTLSAINGGQAQITGSFTQESAQSLANQLKFGALPITFQVATERAISATLGDEQLRRGLLAGVIGLGLVVLYSLLQYRALGLVTVASLLIAGLVTYGLVLLLAWRQGLRLSLPSVAGLIVSIGITADSFIVYFERVRDEVRDGRTLAAAVELAWLRARRTILISDAVSFLAAVVLYVLAVGGVRGFAFTLGLTTLVDIAVVFMFTKPMVTLLSRTRFFGGGHRLSGFDAAHLGRAVVYAGRGRVRSAGAAEGSVRGPVPAGSVPAGSGPAGSGPASPGSGRHTGSTDAARGRTAAGRSGPRSTSTAAAGAGAPTIAQRRAAAARAAAEESSLVVEKGSTPGADDPGDSGLVEDAQTTTSGKDA